MNVCRHCGVEVTLSTKFERPAAWVHAPMPMTGWEWFLCLVPCSRMRWYRYCRITVADTEAALAARLEREAGA